MELEEDCADFAGVPLLASLREKLRVQLEGVKSVSDELSSIESMIQDLMQKREDKMYEIEDRKSEADVTQTKINDCKRESLCRLQSLKKRYNYVGSSFSLFDLLPSDLFVHIFKHFTPKDLCFAVMRTSRHFHTMAQSDAIWAFVFSLSFGPIITTDGCKTCKNLSLSRFSSSHSSNSSSTHSSSSSLSSKNNGCVDSPLGKRWGRVKDGDGDALMGEEGENNGNNINNGSNNKGNGKVGSVSWLAGFKHRNEVERNWKESKWTASTLHGHTDWVTCLMVVDDFLISGSFDASIKIWDLETKECRITLSGHTAGINAIDISGEVLLSASLDSTLRVWNLSTNTCTAVLEGHTDQVSHVNFFTPRQQKQQLSSLSSLSPPSLYAVTGSLDGTLRVWDIKASKCMHVLEGHTTGITSMTLCHQYAASGSVDGRIVVWDCLQGTKIFELLGHGDRISGLQFDFATSRLVSCSWDFTVRVWDLKTGICINVLQGHVFRIRCLSLKDNILVTGSWDSDIKVWDLLTGTCIRTLSGHSNYVWGCELQAGGKHVVSSSWDKTVRVWDTNNGRLLSTLDHDSEVLCLHSSSHRIIGASKEIKIWDYSVK